MDAIPERPPTISPAAETIDVQVNRRLLMRAAGNTGVENPAELVDVALQLLIMPDQSAEFTRSMRGAFPGFDLDI